MAFKDKAKKTAYQNQFIKDSYDRVNLTVPKGKKETLQTIAAKHAQSVNSYINQAIDERMERDGDSPAPSEGSTPHDND